MYVYVNIVYMYTRPDKGTSFCFLNSIMAKPSGQPDRQTTGFISFCSRLSRQQSRNINKHWAAARSLTTRLLARSLGGARLSAALSIAATNVIDSCEAKQQWKVRAVYYWHCIRGRSRILAFGLQRYMTSNINFAKR